MAHQAFIAGEMSCLPHSSKHEISFGIDCRRLLFAVATAGLCLAASTVFAQAQPPAEVPFQMELAPAERAFYRNPDGSCVQCSIGMCGMAQNVPAAYTLLWDTEYGSRVRGGSWPSRVESYCDKRHIRAYNVTGSTTWGWMQWAARTRRFAAIGAGGSHFQTLYGWNPATNRWYVCNNNSTSRVDEYTWDQFRRLHLASGQWCVILDYPPPPMPPTYIPWWQ